MTLTQKQLDGWKVKWQSILGLLDWTIVVVMKRGHEIDAEGRCAVTLERKMAAISIRTPEDFPCGPTWSTDAEHTLVHEMIHCHFDPFMPSDQESLEYKLAEQAIDAMATGYVKLDRSHFA